MDVPNMTEGRERLPAIPSDLQERLTDLQFFAIRRIESFSWDLMFVRREGLKEPVIVVTDHGTQLGILEADGRLNLEHKLKFRP